MCRERPEWARRGHTAHGLKVRTVPQSMWPPGERHTYEERGDPPPAHQTYSLRTTIHGRPARRSTSRCRHRGPLHGASNEGIKRRRTWKNVWRSRTVFSGCCRQRRIWSGWSHQDCLVGASRTHWVLGSPCRPFAIPTVADGVEMRQTQPWTCPRTVYWTKHRALQGTDTAMCPSPLFDRATHPPKNRAAPLLAQSKTAPNTLPTSSSNFLTGCHSTFPCTLARSNRESDRHSF